MEGPKEILAQAEVISANVEFYRTIATKYDDYEPCVSSAATQRMLNCDLIRIASLLGTRSKIQCLDCGGGSGNLSLKMLELGWEVTVVDVSPDMLGQLVQKARDHHFAPKVFNLSIEDYFASSTEKYDLVSFSSVLHHVHSYLTVVEAAADRIREDGVFYSNFDPVIPRFPSIRAVFEALDTASAKAFHDPVDFFPGISRRFKKLFLCSNKTHDRPVASPGDLAEYHAKKGLAEEKIIDVLRSKGFHRIDHSRWPSARTWLTRVVNDRLRLIESFRILAQRSIL